ncbi:glycoside hydrolase family 79 protein [Amanita thiersii Skay4041]|uniref:Glycoside hydrolase family 79 protein n=1 Tax=Amanita thiersii Skay4041 TaxID=703135 RepID=A0A2A9NQX1_9AGAR|nr:glycoside hydrolase family 79 protein [Amanita thiersii Skay4041]
MHLSALGPFLGVLLVNAQLARGVTVYYQQGQTPLATATSGAPVPQYTGAKAFNPTTLADPPIPNGLPNQYHITVQDGPAPPGASIPHLSSLFGFSIEMSVVDQVLGRSSHFLNVPFLNLMANLVRRSGRVNIRVGGNTQETAKMVEETPSGRLLEKDYSNTLGTTNSPPIIYKRDLLYLMRNISDFVNVRWFLGIPFNSSAPFNLDIVDYGQEILGEYLIGLQAGNEPDFYGQFGKRQKGYLPSDYFGEVGQLINQLNNDPKVLNTSMLLGPSVASGAWSPEDVWNTGFADTYSANLAYLSVEHYPTDNCAAQFGTGPPKDPQQELPTYLTHGGVISLLSKYSGSCQLAQSKGKPFLMFETNTASCGGFLGVSDAFAASLWALDYSLQMAYMGFSMAMFHVGGETVFYNPFTAPPTNQSTFHQWTVGPIYYSALVMAEVLGNSSQVLDITNSSQLHDSTPAYVIYENGKPARMALINFATDRSRAHDINFAFAIGGQNGQPNTTPAQVKVKYLRADSVTQKENITWAGQTFGGIFGSDGRPIGDEDVQTVQCQANNNCAITLYAPSFALVFLNEDSLQTIESGPSQTFPTTALTNTVNTATFDPAVLETSNGNKGLDDRLGSTSPGSLSGAAGMTQALQGATILGAMVLGAMVILRGITL